MEKVKQRDLLQSGFRYALSLTHNHHDAEDLVQDAWVKLCRRGLKPDSKSLLFTAIRNLYIDAYRRKHLIIFEAIDEAAGHEEALDPCLLDLEKIEPALKRLRFEEREVIYLHYIEGYSNSEIADLTQRSRNTVLSLISRARQKLILMMQKKGFVRDTA